MFLAEAVKEMEFIRDSIDKVVGRIHGLLSVKVEADFEGSKSVLQNKFEHLEELYKKYQQFAVKVGRAKNSAIIQVNNSKLSIADAILIRDVMKDNLKSLENILSDAEHINREERGILCLDLEELFKEVKSTSLSIKTIEGEIDFAMWQVEV